jgi:hypothetical protein
MTDTSEPSYTDEAITAFEETLSGHKYYIPVRASTTTSTQIATRNMDKSTVTIIPEQFRRYAKVFSEEASRRLPKHQPWDHAIDLIPGATIKKCGIYRLTPKELQALCEWLADQLAKGYIRLSKSPMPVPMFFVEKEGSDLRPVQDCRALNDITVKNAAPIPLIPELIDRLHGARYFTKFDIRVGYNNIRIKEGDEYKAAFKTPLGLFEPLVMTFGLCNAPATFQTFMNHIFQDMVDEGHVVVYLDDILIFADNLTLLDKLTHEVLSRLDKFDLYLKPEKCSFAQTTIDYLGLVISEGQITMDPAKVKGITEWPTPTSVKQVQAFLGFCNFYRRFIHNYSTMARPLFDLTKKESSFLWGGAQEAAFRALIHAFTTAPVLALPNHSKPFQLITDTSDFATGAILEQPDALNRWHPVAFHSKSLQPAERNYEIHDKELLAIVRALEIFRHYLEGRDNTTEIWTDHGNLVYFFTKQKLTRRQARWSLYLSHFRFIIIHKPGTQNKSDALSRRPDHKEGMALDNDDRVLLDNRFFTIHATQTTVVNISGDNTIRQ